MDKIGVKEPPRLPSMKAMAQMQLKHQDEKSEIICYREWDGQRTLLYSQK